MVNVEMTNAPNLESVPNVEMTNAFVNNARNANNLARNEAVRRSRAEAVLAKEELKAKKAKETAKKAEIMPDRRLLTGLKPKLRRRRLKLEPNEKIRVVIMLPGEPQIMLPGKPMQMPKRLLQMPRNLLQMPRKLQ